MPRKPPTPTPSRPPRGSAPDAPDAPDASDAGTGSLREAHKRDKTARIREAAVALFREKGFEATTTREIAQRAGVAAGTVFLYVRTKEELVFLIFREEIEQVLRDRFARLPKGPVLARLTHVFDGLLEFYARDPALARVLVREAIFAHGAAEESNRTMTADFLARLAAMVTDARAAGELLDDPHLPAQALAGACFALYLSAVLGVVHGGAAALPAFRAFLHSALEVHLRGLRPHAPAAHAPAARPRGTRRS